MQLSPQTRCLHLCPGLRAAAKIVMFHVLRQTASLMIFRTLLPPLKLVLTNFNKNCDFPDYYFQFLEKSQKLQKSQFLLGTLLPPLPLEFSYFSKNCDFSNFLQFLLLRANLDISEQGLHNQIKA